MSLFQKMLCQSVLMRPVNIRHKFDFKTFLTTFSVFFTILQVTHNNPPTDFRTENSDIFSSTKYINL